MKTHWYCVVMYPPMQLSQEQQLGFTLALLPCTTLEPKLPANGKLVGRVRETRAQALDEMMDYIRAERSTEIARLIENTSKR